MTAAANRRFEASRVLGDAASMEPAIIERAHDLSMSKNPNTAANGRFMKAVAPAVVRWMEAEMQRGSSPDDVATSTVGFVQGIANLVMSWAGSVSGPEGRDDMAVAVAESILAHVKIAVRATAGPTADAEVSP